MDEVGLAESLTTRLLDRYPTVPPEAVGKAVRAAIERLRNARIKSFVPLLAERVALEQLQERRR